MTVLVCDDEKDISHAIEIFLKSEGYNVITAGNGKEAVEILKEKEIHLVLLDIMMPVMDGVTALAAIREFSNVPVIMLTAKSEDTDKILGLNLGADDYITKPFRKAELLSRIRANLRRSEVVRESRQLISGGLVMDTVRHEVRLHGKMLELRPAEYRLLRIFMENPGRLMMRGQILDRLQEETWEDAVEDNTLSVHISRLRAAVGPGFIETVRGFGYRFKEEVREDGYRKGSM